MPVLAITGHAGDPLLGTGYQQEVHLEKLYEDVAEYDVMITNPVQIPTLVDLAVRHAPGPARRCRTSPLPNDIQVADADADPYGGTSRRRAPPKTAPVYLAPPGPAARRTTCSGWRRS